MRLRAYKWGIAATMIIAGIASAGPIVDQHDPAYQIAIERVSRVDQMLEKAILEAQKARQAHPLYSFNYEMLIEDIKKAKALLKPVLYPEQKRRRLHQFVPDGGYFLKSPYSDITTGVDDEHIDNKH